MPQVSVERDIEKDSIAKEAESFKVDAQEMKQENKFLNKCTGRRE